MSTKIQLSWRRNKVFEYLVKGSNQNEIADILKVSNATINNDVSYLRKEARKQIQNHLQERIPMEYNQCLSGIDEILKNAWDIASKSDEKTRLQALTLASECYKHKMDLITNGVVIDDAIDFIQQKIKDIRSKNLKYNFQGLTEHTENTPDSKF
jgi:transcriptional regulator